MSDLPFHTYSIPNEKLKELGDWRTDHNCTLESHGAIGGRITYSFTPTGLGLVTKAECACGAELDLSDYDSW